MNRTDTIIAFLKEYIGESNAVIGLSGGIDSALVATLAAEALGKDKVHGIIMPASSNTQQETNRGHELADHLGISTEVIAIDPMVEAFQTHSPFFAEQMTAGNMKARIRMTLLYGKANQMHAMVLGTGNKTELMLGYFTKYGDAGVDVLPIADLYKKDVRAMAATLGVPQSIIDAPPTAGLWDGQTDEAELGITYDQADAILEAIEAKRPLEVFDSTAVAIVQKRIAASAHKRVLPPICYL